MSEPLLDHFQRPLRDLRISVTDRCNFRCTYCMPLEQYHWIPRTKILRFEEIERLARLFVEGGVRKIRLTGGEPLLRRDLPQLVAQLVSLPGAPEVSLTTNASRLKKTARALREAGLARINVSLDTLDRHRFEKLVRRESLDAVLEGLEVAREVGFSPLKLNMVVQRSLNRDEIVPMARFSRERGLSLRYIEFMDVGNQNGWKLEEVVPHREILEILGETFPVEELPRPNPSDPADRWRWADGTPGDVGVIASVSRPFCTDCTRARITADGQLVTCLFATRGVDLKTPLRTGASDDRLRRILQQTWTGRRDRFSEERLADLRSGKGYDPGDRDKIEMITLGG